MGNHPHQYSTAWANLPRVSSREGPRPVRCFSPCARTAGAKNSGCLFPPPPGDGGLKAARVGSGIARRARHFDPLASRERHRNRPGVTGASQLPGLCLGGAASVYPFAEAAPLSPSAGFRLVIRGAETHLSAMREHLETMLEALDASPGALRRPACRGWTGDYQITGRLGHILADGDGCLLHIHTGDTDKPTPRRWNNVKGRLAFCRLMQDGDDEGILRLDRLPTAAEADLIREALGIRKRRHLSDEELARVTSALERARGSINRPLTPKISPEA